MVRRAKGRGIWQQTPSLQCDSGVYWFASRLPKPSIRTGGQVALTSGQKLIARRTRTLEPSAKAMAKRNQGMLLVFTPLS